MIEDGVKVVHDCQHCCKLHEINKSLAVMLKDPVATAESGYGYTQDTEFI